MTGETGFQYVVVGGGLQGCLLVHALAHHRPQARVLLVERSDELCGNHTWSFHESDVPAATRPWFDPLVVHRWPGYAVKFPGHQRRLAIPYATIPSVALRAATGSLARDPLSGESGGTRGRVPLAVRYGVDCKIESPNRVTFAGGEEVRGDVVIDCRGLERHAIAATGCGYQSFLGLEIETDIAWPAVEPTVMDVGADQTQGFEFLYELPFARRRVLLEYTRFSDAPALDDARANEFIGRRLREVGVGAWEVVRTERGCLPMPFERQPVGQRPTISGGYAGGWFHAATGYSLAMAVRFADTIARCEPQAVPERVASLASQDALRRGFARFLNRLLFRLVDPAHRWKVFRRFYRVLPEDRIARFYAHRFTFTDAMRIVVGRPPSGLAPIRFARSLFSSTRQALP